MRGGVFISLTCARKLLVGSRGRHVGARPCTEAERRLAGAVGFHRAGTESNQHSAARTRRKRACCAFSRERESARSGVIPCAHAQESCLLEAAAGTSERGRAPRERAASLVQRASIGQKPTPTSAARTRRKRVLLRILPRERERARWRYCLRTYARKLLVGSRSRHVGARPCAEGEGRLAGAVGFHRAGTDFNQRGAARTRRKRACCAFFRERERACWRYFLRTCARNLLVGSRGWHVGARPCTKE